jgi:hypothetical protein
MILCKRAEVLCVAPQTSANIGSKFNEMELGEGKVPQALGPP